MTEIGKNRAKTAPVLFLCLFIGLLAGVAWSLSLDDEEQRRIKKGLFELREMPFRIFV